MFRVQKEPPRVYAVGPSHCGKTMLITRLRSAGYSSWNLRSIETFEMKTFITIPHLENQYFLLFKGSLVFPCSRRRIPEAVVAYVEALADYEALVYDADRNALYVADF